VLREYHNVIFIVVFYYCDNVSDLHNNSVVENINGMAYIFILLIFIAINSLPL
jgi:hypothetical protein